MVRYILLIVIVFVSLILTGSQSVASRHDLDAMFSGGPWGEGRGCTECHEFQQGIGRVRLEGMPGRYRPGAIYDLTIRILDPERAGAGFQISAEGGGTHRGQFTLSDPIRTAYAGFDQSTTHVMHTETGVLDSIDQWAVMGGSYDYPVRWHAPPIDVGPITFFVSGNAINNNENFVGDHFYSTHVTVPFADAADADGDADVDLADFVVFQTCFGADIATENSTCAVFDVIADELVSLDDHDALVQYLSGPVAMLPGSYRLADAVRGGQLYDRWWEVVGLPAPTGIHPLYPDFGVQTGSVTYRCKECHGWDYKGVDGRYGTGSHYTGIPGVFGTTLSASEIFALLAADSGELTNGHGMRGYGLSDSDLWDLTRWTLESTVDVDDYITSGGVFMGNSLFGQIRFTTTCASCHGFDGVDLNFGTESAPEYVGTVAAQNPWEFLHKIRFGQPATSMSGSDLLDWTEGDRADLGSYAETLPTD